MGSVVELVKLEEQEIDPKISTRGSRVWASKVRREAKRYVRVLDHAYLDLAKALYDIYFTRIDNDPLQKPVYSLWGYNSFSDYVEGELGLDERTGRRLRHMWEVATVRLASANKDQVDRFLRLGMARLRELCRVVKPESLDQWINVGENNKASEVAKIVASEVRRLEKEELERTLEPEDSTEGTGFKVGEISDSEVDYNPENEEPAKMETFAFRPQQNLTVLTAIEKAEKLSNSNVKSHNLELICNDFLATNDFDRDNQAAVATYLNKAERLLGVRLIAFEPESKEVVFGFKNLEDLQDDNG